MSFNVPGAIQNPVSPVVENVAAVEEDMEEVVVAAMVVVDFINLFLVVAHLQRRSAVSQLFLVARHSMEIWIVRSAPLSSLDLRTVPYGTARI